MPFTLHPSSRRQFLTGSLSAVAGSVLGRDKSIVSTVADSSSWIFFSDTHIAADYGHFYRGNHLAANFQNCIKQALDVHGTAAGVFISGDCAFQCGNLEDYGMFAALLKPLRAAGLPVHLMMGNHDHRENFLAAFNKPGPPSPVEHRIVGVVESPLVNWFMLDSLDKTNGFPGVLGSEQRAWLEKSLDAHADKPAIIVLHHNITPSVPDDAMQPVFINSLTDSHALLNILAPRKQVKACIYGHTHNWSVIRESSGIHFINLPTTAYPAFDDKWFLPLGWVHASVRNNGMTLNLNCIDPSHPQHASVVNLTWRV